MSDTVLVLKNEEVRGLLGMAEAIDLVEGAYRDLGHNNAQVINRRRLHLPLLNFDDPTWFFLNVIPGAVSCQDVAAVRLGVRREMDDEVAHRADVIIVNSISQVKQDLQPEIMESIRRNYVSWD